MNSNIRTSCVFFIVQDGYKKVVEWAAEMTQRLGELTAHPEDAASIPTSSEL